MDRGLWQGIPGQISKKCLVIQLRMFIPWQKYMCRLSIR